MSAREWSRFQHDIFDDVARGQGHTVVIARAGTGKTSTIVESFNYLPPNKSTLMVAFNKSIADELRSRAPIGVEVLTLHSYGFRAVKKAFPGVKLDNDKVVNLAKQLLGGAWETRETRAALKQVVSLAKSTLATTAGAIDELIDAYGIDIGPEAIPVGDRMVEVTRAQFCAWAVTLLAECKQLTSIVDFDDMVWLPIAHELRPFAYDRVFIDETQDLNACQIELALKACKRNGRICAVGDPRQAIYRFRGADANAVDNVIDRLGAHTLPLSITYRCARAIVAVANEIVPDLEAAPGAQEGIIERINSREILKQRVEAGDFVLSRTNAPLVGICLSLLKQGRRAKIQGRDIGGGLIALLKKSGAESILDFSTWLREWHDREVARLAKLERDTETVDDKYECLVALSEGESLVSSVVSKIEALFKDPNGDAGLIVLSTTHKAKGLERERVWVLADTYWKGRGVEEDNLWYVAVTRAKRELILVGERRVPRSYGGAS